MWSDSFSLRGEVRARKNRIFIERDRLAVLSVFAAVLGLRTVNV